MKKSIRNLWFSFPVVLLVLHLRKHLFMLLPYLFLILIVTHNLGSHYGLDTLFLDPEYIGNVNGWCYFILGFAFGGFVLTWQMTSYILHSFRFPFLATFEKPFLRYMLNNSLVPLLFLLIYFSGLFVFKTFSEEQPFYYAVFYIFCFLTGMALMMGIAFAKYFNTHKSEEELEQELVQRKKNIRKRWLFSQTAHVTRRSARVDFVLIHPFRVRPVRDVSHYSDEVLQNVFRKHHVNALKFLFISIVVLVLLGLTMDYPAFRIPAGASIILLFTVLISPVGALSYWLKTWATTAFILVLISINLLMKFDFLNHRSSAYGLNYNVEAVDYSLKNICDAASPEKVLADKNRTLQILENWKRKNSSLNDSTHKPKIIFINASGGGLRAAVWAFYCTQLIDSLSQNSFYKKVQLISGASGGMMGASYYRELIDREKKGERINPADKIYLTNVSKDLLNAVGFAIVVNDLFVPWQTFSVNENTFSKDRGYLFEKQWNENTDNILDKKIGDYTNDEFQSQIPMIVFSPVITEDARRFNISAQPVSYLDFPSNLNSAKNNFEPDGIDLFNFFQAQNPADLKFASAMRMNATFPYIMPNVYLPTNPAVQVMDAGLRDDYGAETTVRFAENFKDWIDENTSGVIVLQLRSFNKNFEPKITEHPSLFSKMLDPINSIFNNWSDYEDYQQDEQLNLLQQTLSVPLHVISLEYLPTVANQSASMSWHLTLKEKQDVLDAVNRTHNQEQLKYLFQLLSE